MSRLRLSALLVLVLCPALPAVELPSAVEVPPQGLQDYAVTTWNENDGLSAPRIMALAQDKDGYLWLGTDVGLVRFDGVTFEPFPEIDGIKLPVSPTSALISATDGSLWMGVISTLGVMRIQGDKLTTYGAAEGLPGNYPVALIEDASRTVWVGNSAGLFRFDGRRFQAVKGQPGLSDRPVMALLQTRDGRLWVATREAVFRRDREGEPFHQIDVISRTSNVWQKMSEAPDGSVWIGDLDHGFRRIKSKPSVSHKGWGAQVLHDTRGNMWVATRGQGLWRVRPDPKTNGSKVDIVTTKEGLATDAVQCLLEDREGNIWLGTYAGLHRLTPHRVEPITTVPLVRAVAATPDGSIWVGGTNGLTRYVGHETRRYDQAPNALPNRLVLALYADQQGTLWVSTADGLTRFANETFTPVISLEPKSTARIFSIARTRSGLWLRDVNFKLSRATTEGVVSPATEVPAEFQMAAVSLTVDSRDNLWIGSTNGRLGVLRSDGEFQPHYLGTGNIRAIYESKDGTIWAGGDEGLSIIVDGRATTFTEAQGIPNHVKAIVEDAEGVIWVGAGTVIARIERAEFAKAQASRTYQIRSRLFNTADGTAGVPVNDGSRTAVRASNGLLWFATSAGMTRIDPQRIGEPRRKTTAVLERITVDARRIEPTDGVTLPAGSSHVQFSVRALTLTDSMRAQFKYRLDGIDRDWIYARTSREATYTNLAPGPYVFRVIASNGDGVWGTPSVLNFVIAPTFFQTGLFYALCGLAACSLVVAAWRLNARRVRKRFALVLAERIRMSRAIHDTLLQGLAGLALQLDDLSQDNEAFQQSVRDRLRRIRRRVEEYIREARQSIWDLRSPVLERRSFPDALREVGSRVIAERPVTLDVNVKGNPQACSPVVEQQLLLIYHEALVNAVRHGQPSNVDVELEYGGDRVRVCVSDDGRGFDPTTLNHINGHFGVVSMKERAAQVRGKLTIASTPGKGTQVETVVPAY